jgi:hypothetical protein
MGWWNWEEDRENGRIPDLATCGFTLSVYKALPKKRNCKNLRKLKELKLNLPWKK